MIEPIIIVYNDLDMWVGYIYCDVILILIVVVWVFLVSLVGLVVYCA